MTGRLKILFKVILRRTQAGESKDAVFADYGLLTAAEKTEIIAALDAVDAVETEVNK